MYTLKSKRFEIHFLKRKSHHHLAAVISQLFRNKN
jgi:hypothetical protein